MRGLTQQQLAEKAGISQQAVGHAESGLRENPRVLPKIAQALGVPEPWLRYGPEELAAMDASTIDLATRIIALSEEDREFMMQSLKMLEKKRQ